jgi:pimeloyl-ACP methyl ester carboxylesterase
MANTLKRWWWLFLLLALAAILTPLALFGVAAWALAPSGPMPEALPALQSDTRVQVSTEPWLAFRPQGTQWAVGLVFYPGARVDPRAYAPAARAIAAQGYTVVITPMPLNLAVLAPDRATEVIAAYPEVRRWAIGGHSLGGAMAARYAHGHSSAVQGLVLWASYPDTSDDLSTQRLAVVSIYGTRDGLSTVDKVNASRRLLPPGTRWAPIEGGNHAQFGWYGPQQGDNEATIGREAQQQQVVAATLDLLATLAGSKSP